MSRGVSSTARLLFTWSSDQSTSIRTARYLPLRSILKRSTDMSGTMFFASWAELSDNVPPPSRVANMNIAGFILMRFKTDKPD